MTTIQSLSTQLVEFRQRISKHRVLFLAGLDRTRPLDPEEEVRHDPGILPLWAHKEVSLVKDMGQKDPLSLYHYNPKDHPRCHHDSVRDILYVHGWVRDSFNILNLCSL